MPHHAPSPAASCEVDYLLDAVEQAILDNPTDEHLRMRIIKLQRVLDEALAAQAGDTTPNGDELVDRILVKMSANVHAPLTIAQLASEVGVSPTLLKQRFRKAMGMPVYQWYRMHKIERACVLLRETDLTIAEIAGVVGYANPSKFSQAFRDVIGCTPNVWRKSNR